ncbi:MAG: hypothetical protein QM820_44115 [Minicystis sp.]
MSVFHATRCGVMAGALLMMTTAVGCGAGADGENVAENVARAVTFEEFLGTVYQDPTGKYIYDGDMTAHDMASLRRAWEQAYPLDGALTVSKFSPSADDIWQGGAQLNLTYCISNDFGANKQAVVDAMGAAGAAWSANALVNFVYVPAQDASCTSSNGSVVFNVNLVSGTNYLAASFLPSTPRAYRTLNIDTHTFGIGWPLSGILMHELGHTLGFRHEFLRAGLCQAEGGSWRGVTPYDTGSIMDYPYPDCGGTNPFSGLDQSDMEGAAQLYGSRVWGAPTAATGCGQIVGGKGLGRGQFITSCDNGHLLYHNPDGSLVLYKLPAYQVTWTSGTAEQAGYGTYMQTDGNLVIYSGLGRAIWHTNTWGHPGSVLAVQNDGNLVIYSPQGQALWNSGTWGQ